MKGNKEKDVFTCPMHPNVKETKPGKCPQCGMNLTPKTAEMGSDHSKMKM